MSKNAASIRPLLYLLTKIRLFFTDTALQIFAHICKATQRRVDDNDVHLKILCEVR